VVQYDVLAEMARLSYWWKQMELWSVARKSKSIPSKQKLSPVILLLYLLGPLWCWYGTYGIHSRPPSTSYSGVRFRVSVSVAGVFFYVVGLLALHTTPDLEGQ
jgi:hypothetical protein